MARHSAYRRRSSPFGGTELRRGRRPPRGRPGRAASAGACLLAAALLAACGTATGPDDPPAEIDRLPRDLTAQEGRLIDAANGFGFRLLTRMRAEAREDASTGDGSGNVFLSPLSASMALGMALNGAREETLHGMRAALGLEGLSLEETNRAYHDLIRLLAGLDPGVELLLANGVWLQEGYPIRTEFVADVEDSFGAEVANVDFRDPATADRINEWVEEKTAGKITDFVEPVMLRDLIALLANAVYFRGDWRSRFDPDATETADFHLGDGKTVRTPLMRREELEARFASTPDFEVADLPYGGAAFSMTVVLPPPGVSVDSLVEGLDREGWERILASLEEGSRTVVLPRFELTWEELLNDALKAMGMAEAFDPARADFRRLSERALQDELHISWVKQKAFIRVDEEGTEAAAATGVGIGPTSAAPEFRADRPFVFAIRERLSGTVLFLGVMLDPTAG